MSPGPKLKGRTPGPRPGSAASCGLAGVGCMGTPSTLSPQPDARSDPSATANAAASVAESGRRGLLRGMRGGRVLGEAKGERGADARLALDREPAAVQFDDLFADRQPQAAASGRTRAIFVHPVEPLE